MLILEMTDGTTTLDLMGTTYHLVRGSLDLGNPGRITSEASNLYRNGWDLITHGFTKRTVRMQLNITSSGIVGLGTAWSEIEEALRLARDYQTKRIGNRWRLKVNLGGATDVYFNIQNGSIPPAARGLRSHLLTPANPYTLYAPLILECDPIGEGAEETLHNALDDPSYEVAGTPLADWTPTINANHTVTINRVTTQQKYGLASAEFNLTNSAAGVNTSDLESNHMAALPGEVWSFGFWINVTAFACDRFGFQIIWKTAAFGNIAAITIDMIATTPGWVQISLLNQTAPALTAWVTVRPRVKTNGAGQTGTAYYDGGIALKAAALPNAWISGQSIANHFDDNGQAHLNYIDIHDVPGDYPAKVQLKAAEAQAHTKMWLGARIRDRQYDGGLWHEGEDFDNWTSEPADANASAGNYGRYAHNTLQQTVTASGQVAVANNIVVNINPSGIDRILIVGVAAWDVPAGALPTGVTFGAAPLTRSTLGAATAGNLGCSIWYLVNPAVGAANVTVTFAGVQNWIGCGCTVYEGVCQKSPLSGTGVANNGNSNAPTVTVPSEAGDMVVDAVMFDGFQVGVQGAGQTLRWSVTDGINYYGQGSEEVATGTSTVMDWVNAGAAQNWISVGVSLIPAATPICPHIGELAVATPPVGDYRVLARVRGALLSDFEVAMGYEYGGVDYDPSLPVNYESVPADNVWGVLDIGSLVIPPGGVPDGATIGTVTLRLAIYHITHGVARNLEVDWVMLMPVDFGDGYSMKDSAQEVMVSDTISRTPEITRWDTADLFLGRPVQEGSPPFVDPDGFRVYYVWDNGTGADITNGADVVARIRSRWMVLA